MDRRPSGPSRHAGHRTAHMPSLLSAAGPVVGLVAPTDADLDAAARLLASSVPVGCNGTVAYHANGFRAFLAAALTPPPGLRTVLLRGVHVDGRLVAVADWRLVPPALHLNGIAVDPATRGVGLGGTLLADGLALARELGCDRALLDVSRDNPGARRLYLHAGFADVSHTTWTEVTPAPGGGGVRALDWPAFAAHRAAYGFGDLRVRVGPHSATLRVVGTVLRAPAGPLGGILAGGLAGLLGTSRAYAIEEGTGPAGFAAFARMSRPVPPAA